jgi:protocatechuate 3,4-dioxygenase beta subunit
MEDLALEGIWRFWVSRRTLLLTVASAVLSACTSGVASRGTAGSAASPSVLPSASPTLAAPATPAATPACVVRPAETEGPYFVDEKLNRSDIRVDPVDGASKAGVPLTLTFTVYRADGAACTPLSGVQVDVWHCDGLGVYSDAAAQNTQGKRFLRGYQVTDMAGNATFQTIFPGWYSGRAVHIHFKMRTFTGSQKTYELTSQLFFNDAVLDAVFSQAPYNTRGSRDTRNAGDMVYTSGGNSGAQLMLDAVRGAAGYSGAFGIGLQL